MPGLVLLAVLATLVGLFAPAYLAPTPVAADTYTVQPGDTASTIAAHIGIPTDLLLALNPQVQSPSLLLVGQILTVPDGSTLPPLTTPPHPQRQRPPPQSSSTPSNPATPSAPSPPATTSRPTSSSPSTPASTRT